MLAGEMIPVACPHCGKKGTISAKLLPAQGVKKLTCPSCKGSFECGRSPDGAVMTREREVTFIEDGVITPDALSTKIFQKIVPSVHTHSVTTETVSTKSGQLVCPGCGSNNVTPKERGQVYTRTVVYDSATGTKKEESGQPPILICRDCNREWPLDINRMK